MSQNGAIFSMLSNTGLIYHRPAGENSSWFQFHTLPGDGRSISRNVAVKRMGTTESTNTNIFKTSSLDNYMVSLKGNLSRLNHKSILLRKTLFSTFLSYPTTLCLYSPFKNQ